jgi:5'-deoxynucleotidase
VKYYNDGIRDAYRTVESAAKDRLLSMLPETLRPDYEGIITRDSEADRDAWRLVKAADTLSAYIKCLEELASGNSEFAAAAKSTRGKLEAMGLPEVELFLREFIGAFSLSLDEFGI